jgi:hypothetical protein
MFILIFMVLLGRRELWWRITYASMRILRCGSFVHLCRIGNWKPLASFMESIYSVKIRQTVEDKICWRFTNSGVFDV